MRRGYEWGIAALLAIAVGAGFGLGYLAGPGSAEAPVPPLPEEVANPAADPIVPLPLKVELDARKVALGRRLFGDPRLSGDGTIACDHCHDLARGGVDRLVRSRGIGGREGVINAPTVFNSGFNFRQFWNGRAETLDDQVEGPLQDAAEMGSSWERVRAVLQADGGYAAAFAASYRDGIQWANFKDAVATYERSLVTPNSRFDRYLRGDASALSAEEAAGYRLFKQAGCISCHQGINIGGNMYQKLGIMEDYFAVRGRIGKADLGLFAISGREQDRYFFKVPSLRNVALTAPYLHDGSAATLDEAVKVMARYQLGKEFSQVEIARLAGFLRTLTGEYQGKPLE